MNIAKVLPKFSALKFLNCAPKYYPAACVSSQRYLSTFKQNESTMLNIQSSNVIQKRFKKKMSGKQNKTGTNKRREMEEKNDEEDDDDDDDEEVSNTDDEIVQSTTPSLELIVCGKYIFNIARHTYEDFYQKNLVRVNGERVGKKHQIQTNDEIDLIRGFNAEDKTKLDVRRVIMLSVDDKAASSGRVRISFKRRNKLVIDNYPTDPLE